MVSLIPTSNCSLGLSLNTAVKKNIRTGSHFAVYSTLFGSHNKPKEVCDFNITTNSLWGFRPSGPKKLTFFVEKCIALTTLSALLCLTVKTVITSPVHMRTQLTLNQLLNLVLDPLTGRRFRPADECQMPIWANRGQQTKRSSLRTSGLAGHDWWAFIIRFKVIWIQHQERRHQYWFEHLQRQITQLLQHRTLLIFFHAKCVLSIISNDKGHQINKLQIYARNMRSSTNILKRWYYSASVALHAVFDVWVTACH